MLTIALDEQGDFEGLYEKKATGKPIFIGGIIFDDKENKQEFDLEKQRIHYYLKSVCESTGSEYPTDLHVNNNQNGAKVKLVKTKIAETLSQFMRYGTCSIENSFAQKLNKLPKRTGTYHIFSNMICDDGSQKVRMEESMLAREDYASNLYIHMAEDVVERIIFHNPIIDKINHIHLELATRRVVLEGDDCDAKAEQYQKLGYQEDKNPEHLIPGRRIFCLTNKDIYRTAIQREMMDTEQKFIRFDAIGVKSIYYGQQSGNYRMEFLYLADIICSNLGFQLPVHLPEQLVWEFKRRADSYTGHEENLIFVHDAVDIGFRKAWAKLEDRDYFNALRIAYDAVHLDNPYAFYYQEVWLKMIRARLKKETSLTDYRIAVDRLLDYTRQNNLDQSKLMYIFGALEEMKDQMNYWYGGDKAVFYKLYDSGVSAYCHLGNPGMAMKYFEKCKEYAKYIDFETYIRTRSKLSVCLCDEFQYEEAEILAEENKYFYEELVPLRRLISDDDSEQTLNYGITCSQLGQSRAFQRKGNAEESFLEALSLMEEYSPNYFITVSYLLHFYLDMGMKEKYEKLSVDYFGGKKGLREQFSYILSEGNKGYMGKISMKFALYVFVRGIYNFYMEKLSTQMLSRLLDIESAISKAGAEAARQIGGHPWEIIYKYLAMIAWDSGYKEKAEEYIEKTKTAAQNQGSTIDMICWFGQIEFALYKGQKELAEIYFSQIPKTLKKESFFWDIIPADFHLEEAYSILNNVFTFMYR